MTPDRKLELSKIGKDVPESVRDAFKDKLVDEYTYNFLTSDRLAATWKALKKADPTHADLTRIVKIVGLVNTKWSFWTSREKERSLDLQDFSRDLISLEKTARRFRKKYGCDFLENTHVLSVMAAGAINKKEFTFDPLSITRKLELLKERDIAYLNGPAFDECLSVLRDWADGESKSLHGEMNWLIEIAFKQRLNAKNKSRDFFMRILSVTFRRYLSTPLHAVVAEIVNVLLDLPDDDALNENQVKEATKYQARLFAEKSS